MEQRNNFEQNTDLVETPKYLDFFFQILREIGETGHYKEDTYQKFFATKEETDKKTFNDGLGVINILNNNPKANEFHMQKWKEAKEKKNTQN